MAYPVGFGRRWRRKFGKQTYTQKVKALGPLAYWPLNGDANDASGNGYNGAATGVTYGAANMGDGGLSGVFDGSTSFIDIYSAGFAGAVNTAELTVAAWCKVAAGSVWTDGSNDIVINISASTTNAIRLYKTSTNNNLQFQYYAGGTNKNVNDTSLAGATGWFHFAMTVTKAGDAMIAYLNGAKVGATQTGLGVWSGALLSTTTTIGALNTTPIQPWTGLLSHVAVFTSALSAAQIATLATA